MKWVKGEPRWCPFTKSYISTIFLSFYSFNKNKYKIEIQEYSDTNFYVYCHIDSDLIVYDSSWVGICDTEKEAKTEGIAFVYEAIEKESTLINSDNDNDYVTIENILTKLNNCLDKLEQETKNEMDKK